MSRTTTAVCKLNLLPTFKSFKEAEEFKRLMI